MLRYRGYDWALVHGESCIEVDLWSAEGGKRKPFWRLTLHYIAVGAEWRRCGKLERPHFSLEVMGFDVPPGDWRNLSEVNFWNQDESEIFSEDESWINSGDLRFHFANSYLPNGEVQSSFMNYFAWRVVKVDGALITIELSADGKPFSMNSETLQTVSAIPSPADAPEQADAAHEIYLIETIPFGTVSTTIPRNSADPYAHAEELSRRHLRTPAPDHAEVRDFIESKHENLHADLHVKLHYFGFHGS